MAGYSNIFDGIERHLMTFKDLGAMLAFEAARDDRTGVYAKNWGRAPMLLQLDISLNEKYGDWDTLTWSIVRDQRDIFDGLVAIHRQSPERIDIDSTDSHSGWNPLVRAGHLGRTHYARTLVSLGATRGEEAAARARAHGHAGTAGAIETEMYLMQEADRRKAIARAEGIASGQIVVLPTAASGPNAAPSPARAEAPIVKLRPRR